MSSNKYLIVHERKTKNTKFHTCKHEIAFELKHIAEDIDKFEYVRTVIEDLVQLLMKELNENDKIGFTFTSEDFKDKAPGWLNYRYVKDVKVDDVWNVLGSIIQSNASTLGSNKFIITATSISLPRGKGNRKVNCYNTYQEECKRRRGIVFINNRDNLCLPRAIVVAIAYAEKNKTFAEKLRKCIKKQTIEAEKLCNQVNLQIPAEGAGINELKILQQYLTNYNIVVYEYGDKGKKSKVFFKGEDELTKPRLNLLLHKSHYCVINSLTAAFGCSYYCELCNVAYNIKNRHRCQATCPCCQQAPPCTKETPELHCRKCNRMFRNKTCFKKHIQETICDIIKKCEKCLKTYNKKIRKGGHKCNEIYCKVCKIYKPDTHYCFMKPDFGSQNDKNTLFIFFDYETQQHESPHDKNLKIHVPNLCISMQYCKNCMDDDAIDNNCRKCGKRQHIFQNTNTFMSYLFEKRKNYNQVICISHNGQAFDTQFILQYIFDNTDLQNKVKIIMKGTKLILLQIENIKFIDSLNYFPMALSELPKAFGFEILKKGYFPHLFNTPENDNYKGPLPDIKFYEPDSKKPKEREVFLKWYNERKATNNEFDMKQELEEYCRNDVYILSKACLKFREQIYEKCKVCPFTESTTIASACNLIFRRNFLKENVIGILPAKGYRCADKHSKISLQWLLWEEKSRNINIQHAGKQKEVILPNTTIKVDGFCHEKNQVFEFQGCFYHGHDACFKVDRNKPLYKNSDETFNSRFERTKSKIDKLKSLGYDVIEMWECRFIELMDENEEIKKLSYHPIINNVPLIPRDAFYGGRTGNTKRYYKTNENEVIKYIDICSLYPWVCKYGKFPIKHPTPYVGDDCNKLIEEENGLQNIDGFIKCTILPPTDLYHPVLPQKMNQKLLFVLCRTCGETLNQGDCNHSEEERALSGTWVIDEVLKAVKKNYKIIKIYEILKYECKTYNLEEKEEGLFTSFINTFLKIKQEASGWESNCTSEEAKNKYIEEYEKHEGIRLDKEKISVNPGLRSLAKLILNSFWGKFGQQENQPKTDIINKPYEYFKMFTNPLIEVNTVEIINDEVLLINWNYKDEEAPPLNIVNCAIAAYVTAQARLKLYSYLEKLGERVLYYDTDSVIYVSSLDKDNYEPPTGPFLGDMTDELECYGPGSHIVEFVSIGPKMYAYSVSTPGKDTLETVCKMRGITLNYQTLKTANMAAMKSMISDNNLQVTVQCPKIIRTRNHQVASKENNKTIKLTQSKRKLIDNYDSVPYGYKKTCTE